MSYQIEIAMLRTRPASERLALLSTYSTVDLGAMARALGCKPARGATWRDLAVLVAAAIARDVAGA